MEALLTGVPQFLMASINCLITATVARYVIETERFFHKVGKSEIRLTHPLKFKAKAQWWLLLAGWWAVALSMLMAIGRIIASAWFPESVELTHGFFVRFDLAIIILTAVGYFLLAFVNILAWSARPWKGQ